MTYLLVILMVVLVLIALKARFLSFRAQRPEHYADTQPSFSIRDHLSGPMISEGVVYGPTGRMTNSFVAKMQGSYTAEGGTLSEDFTYSNGKTQHREWTLRFGNDNRFTATAPDLVGEARGVISGATAMLRYRIILPEESGGHTLDAVDWMYLMADGTIMNKSELRKYGIKVAELVATMRPATA